MSSFYDRESKPGDLGRKDSDSDKRQFWAKFLAPFIAIPLVVVFRIIIGLFGELWRWLELTLHQKWATLLGCVTLLLVGWILFSIRLRWRFQYGLMEITFALASGWKWFSANEENGTTDLLAGLAVVYLIVRGLDNCYQAMREQAARQMKSRESETKPTEEAAPHV
ncbi:MAG TPA: hypothetical protein VKV04_08610 [Verrucomicrobiae bacterium]|nr:hypothetical protein [Verrucomicrobiae bacterium]